MDYIAIIEGIQRVVKPNLMFLRILEVARFRVFLHFT
jgi:hypothetical protein